MGEVRCSINSPSPRVERVSQSELRFEACGMARLMMRKSGIFHPLSHESKSDVRSVVAGGGISGLSAADAAIRRGLNVVVIEKGVYGKEAASGLNAGQFLTGWAKPVDTMIAELAQQDMQRGLYGDQAQRRAERRVRAFLRRTVEGCQRLEQLDRDYNLRASVQHGACTAAMTEVDMASPEAAYRFMAGYSMSQLAVLNSSRRRPDCLADDAVRSETVSRPVLPAICDRIVGLATGVAPALLGLRLRHRLDVSTEVLPTARSS
jgi:glycine/D-amino acid oxidase-like deaminating enzyme